MEGILGIYADFLNNKHQDAITRVAAAHQISVHYFKDEADLDARISECEVIYGNVPPEKLYRAKALRWLACTSSGVEPYIPEEIYPRDGVILTNSAGAYGVTISEHIMMTLLMLMRKMPTYMEQAREHIWSPAGRIHSIFGSTITIVGTGDIGTSFAQRAKAMGAAQVRGVHRTNRALPRCFDESYSVEDLNFALVGADAVVLCVPSTPETKNLMCRERLELLNRSALLINVGRGDCLDQEALMDALNGGKLAGAAIDVAVPEPLPRSHPLWSTKNLIITPHVSGNNALEFTCDLNVNLFCQNLIHYCRGQEMKHVIDRSNYY